MCKKNKDFKKKKTFVIKIIYYGLYLYAIKNKIKITIIYIKYESNVEVSSFTEYQFRYIFKFDMRNNTTYLTILLK